MSAKALVLAVMATMASGQTVAPTDPPCNGIPLLVGNPAVSMPYGASIDYSGCRGVRAQGSGIEACALTCIDRNVTIRHGSLTCQRDTDGTFKLLPTIPNTVPSCSAPTPPPPPPNCTLDCGANGLCEIVGGVSQCYCTNGFYGDACENDAAAQVSALTTALDTCNQALETANQDFADMNQAYTEANDLYTECNDALQTTTTDLETCNTNYDTAYQAITDISTNADTACQYIASSADMADLNFGSCAFTTIPSDGTGPTLYVVTLTDTGNFCEATSASCQATVTPSVPLADLACTIAAGPPVVATPALTAITYTCV